MNRRSILWATFLLVLIVTVTVGAQTIGVPSWVGNLLSGQFDLATQSTPASTQEELPGLGHKFELLFAMNDDHDPQNLTNDVISVITTTDYPAGIGVALRNTPPGFKIGALTNQLQLKYYFPVPPLPLTSRTTTYPNHRVLSGSLVDDSCSFAPTSCGKAYYDLFTFENRTLEQDQDTVKNGQ
jgi:hypothetical protein